MSHSPLLAQWQVAAYDFIGDDTVDVTGRANGQVLKWDNTLGKWKPGNDEGGTPGPVDNWIFPQDPIRPVTVAAGNYTVPAGSIFVVTQFYGYNANSRLDKGGVNFIKGFGNYKESITDNPQSLHLPIFLNAGEILTVYLGSVNGYLRAK